MSTTRQVATSLLTTLVILAWNVPSRSAQATPLKVAAKHKPTDSQWQLYDTRTVGSLTDFNPTATPTRASSIGSSSRTLPCSKP